MKPKLYTKQAYKSSIFVLTIFLILPGSIHQVSACSLVPPPDSSHYADAISTYDLDGNFLGSKSLSTFRLGADCSIQQLTSTTSDGRFFIVDPQNEINEVLEGQGTDGLQFQYITDWDEMEDFRLYFDQNKAIGLSHFAGSTTDGSATFLAEFQTKYFSTSQIDYLTLDLTDLINAQIQYLGMYLGDDFTYFYYSPTLMTRFIVTENTITIPFVGVINQPSNNTTTEFGFIVQYRMDSELISIYEIELYNLPHFIDMTNFQATGRYVSYSYYDYNQIDQTSSRGVIVRDLWQGGGEIVNLQSSSSQHDIFENLLAYNFGDQTHIVNLETGFTTSLNEINFNHFTGNKFWQLSRITVPDSPDEPTTSPSTSSSVAENNSSATLTNNLFVKIRPSIIVLIALPILNRFRGKTIKQR